MLRDEIKQQTAKMKDMSFKEKLSYIWEYYKIPILAVLFLVLGVTAFVHERMNQKTPVLNVVMLGSNLSGVTSSSLLDGFAETLPSYDPEKETMTVNADYDLHGNDQFSLTYMQKLMAEYSIGFVDVTIAGEDDIRELGELQAFGDLSAILPEGLYSRLEASGLRIIHVDYEDPATDKVYDIPAAVEISSSPVILQGFDDEEGHKDYYDGPCFLGISPNSEHLETSIAFLEYILKDI